MMNFATVDQVIPGLTINLRVLSRGTERYKLALFQHEGTLNITEGGTKLGNNDNSASKFQTFFRLVKEQNVDLAMTPEYSCPWEAIRETLDDQARCPSEGKIWVIGAESITPAQLVDFANKYNRNSTIVYFDRSRLYENGVFFDPIVYIFKATISGEPHMIVLIQFKTQHMGVRGGGDLERDRLIPGREIYVIRNDADSVNLITLICSEAMNFQEELDNEKRIQLSWNDRPYLVLNPQVNPDPLHERFIAFRNFVFQQERKEVIGLNWNLNSKIVAEALLRDGTSRSGIYMNSRDVKFDDKSRIRKNHKLGLYYFYSGKDRHAFILNSKPHIYIIEQLSVHITGGVPEQRMRNGPELIETYSYQINGTLQNDQEVSDSHLEYLTGLGCKNDFLMDARNCILEKERLVCLTSGKFLPKSFEGWSSTDKLFSFRLLDVTEINNRITYTEDTNGSSERQRQQYITSVNELDFLILPNKSLYPKSIADLKDQKVLLGYSQQKDGQGIKHVEREKYRYNLVNSHGAMLQASICYLGIASLGNAVQMFEDIQSMFESGSMNRRRVVVFYKVGVDYKVVSDDDAGSILVTDENGPTSFLRN